MMTMVFVMTLLLQAPFLSFPVCCASMHVPTELASPVDSPSLCTQQMPLSVLIRSGGGVLLNPTQLDPEQVAAHCCGATRAIPHPFTKLPWLLRDPLLPFHSASLCLQMHHRNRMWRISLALMLQCNTPPPFRDQTPTIAIPRMQRCCLHLLTSFLLRLAVAIKKHSFLPFRKLEKSVKKFNLNQQV